MNILKNKEALYELRNEAVREYFKWHIEYDCLGVSVTKEQEKKRRECLEKRDDAELKIRSIEKVLEQIKRGSYHYPSDVRTEE
jgi:hypothetical protein